MAAVRWHSGCVGSRTGFIERRCSDGKDIAGLWARRPPVEVDPRGLLSLTANSIGPSANAALRYARSGKPQVVAADLAADDHQRGPQAKYECGTRVWRRTVVVYITLRAFLPSASLSERVLFVGRFKRGYRVWQIVH